MKSIDIVIIREFDFGLFLLLRGCYFQIGEKVMMNMSTEIAFRVSVETVVNWIAREVNRNKTYVLFRTYAPVHFRFA
jgi:hypothetical protein